uniref:Uncharacterized protein n=1 Tax=Pipistrellus kuhlii TaxID=59472 RepID=A0A7J8A8U4_PIPKU|nr:hypothetical protein mPipKuh1_009015 [Pipistrellus kuhlii]
MLGPLSGLPLPACSAGGAREAPGGRGAELCGRGRGGREGRGRELGPPSWPREKPKSFSRAPYPNWAPGLGRLTLTLPRAPGPGPRALSPAPFALVLLCSAPSIFPHLPPGGRFVNGSRTPDTVQN